MCQMKKQAKKLGDSRMNLDSILKSRAFTLPTKVYIDKVKAMVFSVVMYGYERWP